MAVKTTKRHDTREILFRTPRESIESGGFLEFLQRCASFIAEVHLEQQVRDRLHQSRIEATPHADHVSGYGLGRVEGSKLADPVTGERLEVVRVDRPRHDLFLENPKHGVLGVVRKDIADTIARNRGSRVLVIDQPQTDRSERRFGHQKARGRERLAEGDDLAGELVDCFNTAVCSGEDHASVNV
jgi:hypothetical protein